MFHSDREMSQVVKSNGNGNSANGLLSQLKEEVELPKTRKKTGYSNALLCAFWRPFHGLSRRLTLQSD
jgi:hypothetical protein